jgi:histidyl-tRNA synthetase
MFTGKDVPAVGVSVVGLDRLMPMLQELGLLAAGHVTDVLVLNMGQGGAGEYLAVVTELRAAGVNAEVVYQQDDMKKQFRYAEQKGVPFAVLYGEDERARGEVTIRDLATREQVSVPRRSLVAEVLKRLPARAA